jgi:excisionase family DNA binding protein
MSTAFPSAVRAEPAADVLAGLPGSRTIDETCQLLRVSRSTLRTWVKSGQIKVIRCGRRVLIPNESLRGILRG